MIPSKKGQIVRFHTPLEGEDASQKYVLLDFHTDVEQPRANIRELNNGTHFPSINTVHLNDLEVVEISTADLLGHLASIRYPDGTFVSGIITSIRDPKIFLDLEVFPHGVQTNVWITVTDEKKEDYSGHLFVDHLWSGKFF